VVRHNLVQRIIRAYEEYEVDHPQRGNGRGESKGDGKHEHRHAEESSSLRDKQ
jgi:hypothetical protein